MNELTNPANTANPAGGHGGRDLWVLNYLWEVENFPIERLSRLAGGFHAWAEDGREVVPGQLRIGMSNDAGDEEETLDALLEGCGMGHLASGALCGVSAPALLARFDEAGRPGLLAWLQELGCTLPERQKVATRVQKRARERAVASSI